MKFLIFGGAGFVGARIARELNARGLVYRVTKADLRSLEQLQAELADFQPTHVINAAAKGVDPTAKLAPGELEEVNVTGALRLQAECVHRGVKHYIHLGSCFEYGSYDSDIDENCALRPTTPYAESKARASMALLDRGANSTLVLRLFGMWGPGEAPHRLVPQIVAAREAHRAVALTHGRQVRDFTYVDDLVADLVALTVLPNIPTGIINLGSGVAQPVIEFATHVARVLRCEELLQPGVLPERPGEMRRLVASTRKLSTLIQMKPRTTVENGLKQMGVIN